MLTRVFRLVRLLGALAILGGTVASCLEGADVGLGDCPNPNFGHYNRFGDLDPCCIDQTNPCGPLTVPPPAQCDGICLPAGPPPNWFREPVLLWYGNYYDAPEMCPDTMSGWPVFGEPLPPYGCPLCECSDPACVLPSGMIASNTSNCQGPAFTPFSATKPDGCSTPIVIQPNTLKSVSIVAPTVSACAPSMNVAKDASSSWVKKGRVCSGVGRGDCGNDGGDFVCVKRPPMVPAGFLQCVQNATRGEKATPCPAGYPHKITVYQDLDTAASCKPCDCEPPVGSVCTAAVTAYTNNACDPASAIFTDNVSLGPSQCEPVPVNTGLQGMTEKWLVTQPGKCTPKGGDPTGTPIPSEKTSWTFCCVDPGFSP
jgi:hypothetical protein